VFTARYGLSPYIKHITEVESVYCAVRTESLYKTYNRGIECLLGGTD